MSDDLHTPLISIDSEASVAEVTVADSEEAGPLIAPAAPLPEPLPMAIAAPLVFSQSASTPTVVHPRSPRKRMQAQHYPSTKGVRSQPLAPARPEPLPLPETILPQGSWRWRWPTTALVLLAWAGAVLLLTTNFSAALPTLGSPRRVFVLGWILASLVTFAPLQWRLALSGLTWQGVFGWTLSGFLLAWASPPTGNLLSLPDLPGYLLLFLAVFYAAASAVTPIAFLAGQRLFSQRIHRLDARRARRQGYEAGLLAVAVLALANMSILLWWTGLLLVIVIVLLETLFLSRVRPEG